MTIIGDDAFQVGAILTSITIPKSVTSIGTLVGNGLTSIVVEAGNTVYDSRENCNVIIRTSDNELIVGCQNTVIPNSVTSLGYAAFAGCLDLTSIYLPNSVTRIGDWVFPGCSNLTSINIPNSLTSIGTQVFYGCTSLTSVTIPSSVTSIGELVFQYCDGLKEVRSMLKDPFAINENCWEGINPDEITLYVPKGTKELYKAKEGWSVFKDIIEKEDAFFVDNAVYLNDTVARQGGKTTLSLKMKNTVPIRGFQFDLYLPEGVTVAKNSKGKILGALSAGRLPEEDGHTLTLSEQSDGAIRFLCSSQYYDDLFTGNDGEIATLQVKVWLMATISFK